MKNYLLLFLILISSASGKSYAERDVGKEFIDRFLPTSNYSKAELYQIFLNVYPNHSILNLIARPAEKSLAWYEYRKLFLDNRRVVNGVKFFRTHKGVLSEAYDKFGVDPNIIVAIIGVETRYGKVMGNYRVIDALATLGLSYPKRAEFFKKELANYLRLIKSLPGDVFSLKGSYAGAMGMAQFMPSSYLAYAIDYEQDGLIDIWTNPNDAIFSIANYLAQHGWKKDKPIIVEADISNEIAYSFPNQSYKVFTTLNTLRKQKIYPIVESNRFSDDSSVGVLQLKDSVNTNKMWITFNNFNVITKYNISPLYAKVVHSLALEIEQALD